MLASAWQALEPLEVRRGSGRVTTFRFWRCRYLGPPAAAARGR